MRCSEHGGDGYSSECDLCLLEKQTEVLEAQRNDAAEIAIAQIQAQGEIAEKDRRLKADLADEDRRFNAKLAEKQNDILRRGTAENCPKCERPVSGNLGRCPNCATVLQDLCVNCGQENFIGWKCCCKCGLDRGAAAIKARLDAEAARAEREKSREREKQLSEERAKRDEVRKIITDRKQALEAELKTVIIPEKRR